MLWFCLLPYLLIALGSSGFLLLLINFTRQFRQHRQEDYKSQDLILWLTPACSMALGHYSKPGRLRYLKPSSLACRIAAGSFPEDEEPPPAEKFKTWPKQAELICKGQFDELQRYKAELLNGTGAGSREDIPHQSRKDRLNPIIALIAISTIIGGAVLAFEYRDQCFRAGPVTSCPPPPVARAPKSLEVPGDLLFEFKYSQFYSDEHRNKAKGFLKEIFSQLENVSVTSIEAYTDPIGGNEYNKNLAHERGETIRKIIEEIANENDLGGSFTSKSIAPGIVRAIGPSSEDFGIWKTCFKKFYLDTSEKPLEDYTGVGRPLCSKADATTGSDGNYPACWRLYGPDPGTSIPANYPKRASNFREIVACLAPMRHVRVRYEYDKTNP